MDQCGNITLFTTEHKTSSVGARSEQHLPIVIASESLAQDGWIDCFLSVCARAGLDIEKRPLGPLPAPKLNGDF